MIALGIDVAGPELAVAGIREDGSLTLHALTLGAQRGARRLVEARAATKAVLETYRAEACIVLVEIPWASRAGSGSSFVLLSLASVVLEAAQAAISGAVVMEVPTSTWKLESVGRGDAKKDECLAFAQGLGYDGDDQDLADALCMASAGWERWTRRVEDAA